MNQMVNQIMGQQAMEDPIVKAWKMIQACQNPKQALMNALTQNNDFGEIMELFRKNNGDPQKTFFEYAKKQNVDGNHFVKQLQDMGLK